MADVLGNALADLSGLMRDNAGVEVSYARPSTGQSVTLDAVPSVREVQVVGPGETEPYRIEIHDWQIVAADLVLGGSEVHPAIGDTITNGTEVYRVGELGGESHYKPCDPQRTMWRVHCAKLA